MAASGSDKRDPIAQARANWERAGWGDVGDGMVAVMSVMRAHQILLARLQTARRRYDPSFCRFELLRLLAFSRTGALPITKASDRLQVHVTSVTHVIHRLEADGVLRIGDAHLVEVGPIDSGHCPGCRIAGETQLVPQGK